MKRVILIPLPHECVSFVNSIKHRLVIESNRGEEFGVIVMDKSNAYVQWSNGNKSSDFAGMVGLVEYFDKAGYNIFEV